MKLKSYLFSFLFFFISFSSFAQNWQMIWSEEFNYTGLPDSTKWTNEVGLIRNNELQYYTKNRIENNWVANGQLKIIGRKESYKGSEYTSASITTDQQFTCTYGKIEANIKVPIGQGMWPAFWMLGSNFKTAGWPACGEIDILENTGSHPFQIQGTIHGPDYSGENGVTKIIQAQRPLSEDFNNYAISWNENSIEWFFNGVSYNKISKTDPALAGKDWPFNQEFYLIINLAIGGWFPGEVDPDLVQAELQVDWIKYYSENGVGELFLH